MLLNYTYVRVVFQPKHVLMLIKGGDYMADTLKNRERFSTTLDKETLKQLKDFSEKTMIPISKIVDSAICNYINKQKVKD